MVLFLIKIYLIHWIQCQKIYLSQYVSVSEVNMTDGSDEMKVV